LLLLLPQQGYLSDTLISLSERSLPQFKHQHFRLLTLVENQTVFVGKNGGISRFKRMAIQ